MDIGARSRRESFLPPPIASDTDIPAVTPVLALAVTSYREPVRLRLTVRTLLEQSLREIRVRIFDNTEDDRVESRIGDLLSDGRLSYIRNPGNIGSYRNAVQALEWASATADYCALLSDHDWASPGWAAALVGLLERDRGAVSAFSMTMRAREGSLPSIVIPNADTAPLRSETAIGRGREFVKQSRIGDMAFGVHRSDVVRAVPMRPILSPDVAWVAELAYHGRILRHDRRDFICLVQEKKRAEIQKSGMYRRQARMLGVNRSTRATAVRAVIVGTVLRSGFGSSATTSPAYATAVAALLLLRNIQGIGRRVTRPIQRRFRRARRTAKSAAARTLRSLRTLVSRRVAA